MRLQDIATEFSNLNDDELRLRIVEIQKRRVAPPKAAKVAAKKTAKNNEEELLSLIGDMSPEKLKALLGGLT